MRQTWRAFLMCLVAGMAASCTPLPTAQFLSFTEIAADTSETGAEIYGALNEVILWNADPDAATRQQRCAPSARPTCFEPDRYRTAPRRIDPNVEARILALETIAAYTDTLVALASGQTGAAFAERVAAVAGAAGAFARLVPAPSGALAGLLSEPLVARLSLLAGGLEAARARSAVRASLVAEADLIRTLIDLLIEDTSEVYRLYILLQGKYAGSLPGGPRGPAGQAAFSKVGQMHQSLGEYVQLLDNTRQSLDTLLAALETGDSDPATLEAVFQQALVLKQAAASARAAARGLSR